MNRYVEKMMTPQRFEELLSSYEVATQRPDVSGAEHLDMLLIRSELENQRFHLNENQARRLREADTCLSKHVHEFYDAIAQIVDISIWREDENAPPSHWWWYLDVLAYAWPHVSHELNSGSEQKTARPSYLGNQLLPV
ncbi:MAG: hypothetical protein AAF639_47005 [Chloroflexota bacterium]